MLASLLVALVGCTHGGGSDDDSSDTTPVTIIEGTPSFYEARPKNLLVISMDTLRRDYLARYGGQTDTTRYLDRLADEGFVMEQHHSCSDWTHAGTLCALNGVDNVDYGYPPWLSDSLPDLTERPTLSSSLRDLGYQTMLVTSNSWLIRFNIQYGYTSAENISEHAIDVWEYARNTLTDLQLSDPTSLDAPWFVHIHIKEPHVSYNPPEKYLADLEDLPPIDYDLTDSDEHYDVVDDKWAGLSQAEKDLITEHMLVRYRGEIQYLDDQVKEILTDADNFGLLDDTLVVFWTDHGEQMWEHGDQSHAYSLYREENDSIFILWSKNIVPGTWMGPTTHIDIVPTVFAALGHEAPKAFTGQAVGTADPDRPIFAETIARNGTLLSVTQGDNRLIYNFNGKKELYDLGKDPGELTNQYDAKDPTVTALWDYMLPKVEAMYEIVPDLGKPYQPGP
jgi:arylsulfatase A-like enzyme